MSYIKHQMSNVKVKQQIFNVEKKMSDVKAKCQMKKSQKSNEKD